MTLIVMVQRPGELALLAADQRVMSHGDDDTLTSPMVPRDVPKLRPLGDGYVVVGGLEGTVADSVRAMLAGLPSLDRATVAHALARWHVEFMPATSEAVRVHVGRCGKLFIVRRRAGVPEGLAFTLNGTWLWDVPPPMSRTTRRAFPPADPWPPLILQTDSEAMLWAPSTGGPVQGPDAPPGWWAVVQVLARAVRAAGPAVDATVAAVRAFGATIYERWSGPGRGIGPVLDVAIVTPTGARFDGGAAAAAPLTDWDSLEASLLPAELNL